jgi:hypothetical protein
MRRRPRYPVALALALVAGLAAGPAPAGAAEGGVCIAVSGGEHAAVADAAQRALGVPAHRIDVRDGGERAALASRCGRLIIAVGAEALRAADALAPSARVVHVMAPGARGSGRPGVLPDADPRRVIETLQKMAPRVRRIGAVFNPDLTGELVAEAVASARELGIELLPLPARTVRDAVRAFRRFETEVPVDALWLLPDGTATVQETVYYALELAHWRRMAVIGLSRWYVASGALFALLPTPESCGAAAGELGQQLLRGAAPAGDVHAREYALYLNQRAATRLGLKVPRQVLESAEQVLP